MVASVEIVMLILLHVTVSTLGECCLQLVGTLSSAADVLVYDCLPLPIYNVFCLGTLGPINLSLLYHIAELCTCF